MEKPIWEDKSSYSQDKPSGTVKPSIWTIETGSLSITVHRHVHYEKEDWLVSSHEIGIDKDLLSQRDIEKAKEEAIRFVKMKLTILIDEISKL